MHGGLSYPCKYYGRKFFYGNRPLTVDEFLYIVTNPHKLANPLVFTSFLLGVQTLSWSSPPPPTTNRRWKTEFFFVSEFWVGNPVEVGKDPFPPYTGEIGNLHLEGMLLFTTHFTSFVISI